MAGSTKKTLKRTTISQLINSTAIANSWKDIMHGQRKWLTKMSQQFAAAGKNMHRWCGLCTNIRCPWCHQDDEDEEHLFKCSHQSWKNIQLEATQTLRQKLQMCKREPLLRDTIIQKVKHCTRLESISELEIEDIRHRNAVFHQDPILWHNFLLGQKDKKLDTWTNPARYISDTQQWNSASFWAQILTLALWEFGCTKWKQATSWQYRCGTDLQREIIWQHGDTGLLAQDKALIQGPHFRGSNRHCKNT
jgi:hypothetical protein